MRGHRIQFNPRSWAGLLPAALAGRDSISRGEVFEIAETGCYSEVFAASYLWGVGSNGYGPHRYREIVNAAGGRLDDLLRRAAQNAATDVISGYAMLYGGYEPRSRAAALEEPWARIAGLGPAFFTKFLYFTTPGALILDRVLARRVHALSGMPYLVRRTGQPYDWSPYRYCVYLHWMAQTATALQCAAEELELAMFTLDMRDFA